MDIFSILFPEDKEPEKPPKTELETVLENAKELSVKLGVSVTDILLAQLLLKNHG